LIKNSQPFVKKMSENCRPTGDFFIRTVYWRWTLTSPPTPRPILFTRIRYDTILYERRV